MTAKYILLVIHYKGYNKDYPTETKKFTGSSPSPKFKNILDKIRDKREQIELIQYSLKKPTEFESRSLRALGCSALYSCLNENHVMVLLSEIMKDKYDSRPRWLGDYEIYLLSIPKEIEQEEEKYYVLRIVGEVKYKDIIQKIDETELIEILEIHESRSVLHVGEKRIIRSLVGFIMFVKANEKNIISFIDQLKEETTYDIFEVEKTMGISK